MPSLKYLLFFLSLIIFSCSSKKETSKLNKKSFYFWKTSLYDYPWNDSTYKSIGADKIYLRFFDVDWDEQNQNTIPVSPLEIAYNRFPDSIEIVPVVFITNESFKSINKEQCTELALNIHKKIMAKLNQLLMDNYSESLYGADWWEQNPYNIKSKKFDEQLRKDSIYNAQMSKIKEVQFDCDWTKSTKDKYFSFLTESKKLFKNQTVSSTIRLYQYKDPKEAGLPPVDKGMLMCYNAGDVKSSNTTNSIFNEDEIMSYLKSAEKYPIKLDYALPIFEWAVLYSNGKFKNLLSASLLRDEYFSNLIIKDNGEKDQIIMIANKDFVYGNTYQSILIRKGDEIRFETINGKDLLKVGHWLSENKNNNDAILSFYHLNTYDLKKHKEEIKDLFNSF